MNDKEAMTLALEALDGSIAITMAKIDLRNTAIKALEEALANQQQDEPVAWISWNRVSGESKLNYHKVASKHDATLWSHFPLYTTPQPAQKPWVGLTDDDRHELWESTDSEWALMKRVEAKLKEKNT